MKTRFYILAACCMLASATLFATTVVVNGEPDNVANGTFQKLSSAVNHVQGNGAGPHIINITTDTLTAVPDGEIVTTTGMTINGDADGNGIPADILVDMTTLAATPAANGAGQVDSKCYIEIQVAAAVTINDLQIHPNDDSPGISTGNSVDAIRMYRPASGQGTYILNRVWCSGSRNTASGSTFVTIDTGGDRYGFPKKWSMTANNSNSGNNAVIHLTGAIGAGTYNAELNNCMAGLGESNALNIDNTGGTVIVNSGLYGHCQRDGIRVTGPNVTLKGTPTNRLRVVRYTSGTGGDGHGVEIFGGTVTLMEYVDSMGQNTSQNFKFGSGGSVATMRYCRGLGKRSPVGNNHANLFTDTSSAAAIENCTFVGTPQEGGAGTSHLPFGTAAAITGSINFYNCIFTSEYSGVGYLDATNTTDDTGIDGINILDHCALPTDGYTSESLATTPIQGTGAGFVPSPIAPVSVSPHYIQMPLQYDWSQAAVSINGSNPAAGNPDVLRPSNLAYATAATGGAPLVGGAGPAPVPSAVSDWSTY